MSTTLKSNYGIGRSLKKAQSTTNERIQSKKREEMKTWHLFLNPRSGEPVACERRVHPVDRT